MSWLDEQLDPLKLGLSAAIAGDHTTARAAFWRVVAGDSRHEVAWLWLAKVAENSGEQQFCLARALALNPTSERTRLSLMVSQAEEGAADKPPPTGSCPICELPWAQPPLRCARCRAVLGFANPQIFFTPLDVDSRLVNRRLEGLRSRPVLSVGQRRVLVLSLLNLGELLEGMTQLRHLVDGDPRDEETRALMLVLSRRLDAIEIDSGFETEIVNRPTLEELGIS